MLFASRLTALRITALVAILASAILTVDHVRPGREFCPLEQACSAAAESEFGSVAGIPTSVLGLLAFGAVLLLTLLPVSLARRILQPACFLGALAGMGLMTEQALHLDAFCPLCLVADGAAVALGYIALTWPPLPFLRSGRGFSAESHAARTAWGLGMALTIVLPFAWPREVEPAWEEAPELAEALFEEPTVAAPTPPNVDPDPAPPAVLGTEAVAVHAEAAVSAPPPPALPVPPTPPTVEASAPAAVPVVSAVLAPPPSTPPASAPRTPAPAPAKPAAGSVTLVEYLNAFCAHCRATHRRLDEVITAERIPVQRRRVYTWSGKGYPMWARACAYAETVGLEEAMFRELTKARRESSAEVYAAARRAGLDLQALREALARSETPARLVRDRGIARAARLKRLPTFDIGRRRLSGSQSEGELRAALMAAKASAARTKG